MYIFRQESDAQPCSQVTSMAGIYAIPSGGRSFAVRPRFSIADDDNRFS